MRHADAQSQMNGLQREDPEHQFMLREQPEGEWQVVRLGLRPRSNEHLRAERGAVCDLPPDPRPSLIRQIPPYGPPGV